MEFFCMHACYFTRNYDSVCEKINKNQNVTCFKVYLMCSRFCLDSASLDMENRWVCLDVCLCVT